MSETLKSVGGIFDGAIELPFGRREAYLREACAGDGSLRQRVEALLLAHESAGTFMASPAATPNEATMIGKLSEQPGDRIGQYKLLQQIGEGGCGAVYMAEQKEPIRRRVAFKVIKLGMDTKNVIARFEAERHALALMDHPNIAKVLDAGATETGRPYFVMELVRGIKITDYCDGNNLSTVARLELFVLVCQAIQHAHQKGVIHRDIKPSNILVTVNDGVALPKVIDFGIAKATQGRLTDHTLYTAFEQFLGTPAYMSPEQAGMTNQDIDTRSDIYSLGVLLYELLTGRTPFAARDLLQAGLDEIRRTIREQEPVRPSTRLSTMLGVDLKMIAEQRKAEPPKLIHLLRGDLDWIVMKALEKDRRRRYETANGLIADIRRHLSNEPVAARPPNKLYRVQKLIVRNRLAALAGLVVLLSLIACSIFSTLFYFKERKTLYLSYLSEAHALRMGGHAGQRFESLKAVEKAGAIRRGPEVRDEAIASLARSDLRWAKEKFFGASLLGRLAHFDTPFQCYAVLDKDRQVAIRRVADDQQIAELAAPGFDPIDLRGFSSDSRYLKIRSRDAKSRESDWVWDIKTQKAVLKALPGWLADIFSPDGRCFGKSNPDKTFSVYDLASGRELTHTYLGRGLNVAVFGPTNDLVAGVTDDSPEVNIFDLSTGSNTLAVTCAAPVTALAWSFDGNHLAAACADNNIYIWETHDGNLAAILRGHAQRVTDLAFNHAGDLLASASWDGKSRLWDSVTGQCIADFPDGSAHGLEFTADDHYLGVLQDSVHAGLLEVGHHGENRRLALKSQRCSGPAFSADGHIIAGGTDAGVCLWDADSGKKLGLIRGEGGWSQLFHPDGRRLFACTPGIGLTVCSLDRIAGADGVSYRIGQPKTLLGGDAFREADLSPDGCYLVVAHNGKAECIVLDLQKPPAKVVLREDPMVDYVAISPDGHWAASGSWNTAFVKIWDARSGELIKTLEMPGRTHVTFSPDGRWLATSTREYQLWETGSWRRKGPPIQGDSVPEANSLAFNSDGRLMAITRERNKVQLLETMSGNVLATLESPDSLILSYLRFSPDNTRLAAARIDGQIEVWNLRVIRQELAEMQLDWDQPPFPPEATDEKAKVISLVIDSRIPSQPIKQ